MQTTLSLSRPALRAAAARPGAFTARRLHQARPLVVKAAPGVSAPQVAAAAAAAVTQYCRPPLRASASRLLPAPQHCCGPGGASSRLASSSPADPMRCLPTRPRLCPPAPPAGRVSG